MRNPARIRAATPSDVPSLEGLIALSIRSLGLPFYSPEQIESALAYAFGVDPQLIEDGTYFTAEMDGRLAGCGGWSKRRKIYGGDQAELADSSLLDPGVDAARIRAFFVHPDFARRGVGSELLKHCMEAARANGFFRFELMGTLPGEPLYKSFGFTVIERVPTILPDGTRIEFVRMAWNP